MQSSAGGILTVIAIIASLLIAVISQLNNAAEILQKMGVFSYSFYLLFLFSFIYLGFASYYTFQVIRPKLVSVLKEPIELYENIESETSSQISNEISINEISQIVSLNALLKMNEEIRSLGIILKKNQTSYRKCLLASFLSLGSSFLALGHIVSASIFGNDFFVTIIGVVGYLCIIGLIPLFFTKGDSYENQ